MARRYSILLTIAAAAGGALVASSSYVVLLAAVACVLLCSAAWHVHESLLARKGAGRDKLAQSRGLLLMMLLVTVVALACPAVHEAGHLAALAAFGRADLSRTDFIGLSGHPHAGRAKGPMLQGWQEGVIGLSGVMMTNLVGYMLFAVWSSPVGRSVVQRRQALAMFWAGTTCIVLIGQFGWLVPLLGIGHDGDYQGFVWGFRLAWWQAAAMEMVLLAVNGAIIWSIVGFYRSDLRRKGQQRA